MNPGPEPGSDPGLDPGSNPSSDPGSNPGSDPGSDPNLDPGSDPGFILSLSHHLRAFTHHRLKIKHMLLLLLCSSGHLI